MKYDLVIFDCDGVLIDSEHLQAITTWEAMQAIGHEMAFEDVLHRFSGFGPKEYMALMHQELGDRAPDVARDAVSRLNARFELGVTPIEGIEGILKQLGPRICVASNARIDRLNRSLKKTPLAPYFGGNIFSAELVANAKPAPDLGLYCLEKMGAEAGRSVFIDDNMHGVRCAKACGMTAIGFIKQGDATPERTAALRDAGADVVVEGADELGLALGLPSAAAA